MIALWPASFALLTAAAVSSSALDMTSIDFLEVLLVTSSRRIEHEVELKGPFDNPGSTTLLSHEPVVVPQSVGPQNMVTSAGPPWSNVPGRSAEVLVTFVAEPMDTSGGSGSWA